MPPAELDPDMIYVDAVATQGPGTVLDLSYMLILELRDLYYSKCSAFVKCTASCLWICDVARRFCAELRPALQAIYDHTRLCRTVSSGQNLAHVIAFGDRIKPQASYVATELDGICDIAQPIFRAIRPPISLAEFKDGPSIYEVDVSFPMYIFVEKKTKLYLWLHG